MIRHYTSCQAEIDHIRCNIVPLLINVCNFPINLFSVPKSQFNIPVRHMMREQKASGGLASHYLTKTTLFNDLNEIFHGENSLFFHLTCLPPALPEHFWFLMLYFLDSGASTRSQMETASNLQHKLRPVFVNGYFGTEMINEVLNFQEPNRA